MKRRDFVCLASWLSLSLAGFNAHAARAKRTPAKGKSKSKRPSKASSKSKSKGHGHHAEPQDEGNWEELWNGRDLAGWKSNVPPTTGSPEGGQPTEVFSVVEVSGDKLLRISGHRFGALVSEASYRNYQLRVEWRWGGRKMGPPRSPATVQRLGGAQFGGVNAVWRREELAVGA